MLFYCNWPDEGGPVILSHATLDAPDAPRNLPAPKAQSGHDMPAGGSSCNEAMLGWNGHRQTPSPSSRCWPKPGSTPRRSTQALLHDLKVLQSFVLSSSRCSLVPSPSALLMHAC
eukprot:scaffold218833_cov14-Tisochrysis_lutea.AAC.1